MGDGKKLESIDTYNDNGFIAQSVTNGIEVDGVETSLGYTYTPDAVSRVRTVQHPGPAGTLQTYNYDNRGFVTNTMLGTFAEDFGVGPCTATSPR